MFKTLFSKLLTKTKRGIKMSGPVFMFLWLSAIVFVIGFLLTYLACAFVNEWMFGTWTSPRRFCHDIAELFRIDKEKSDEKTLHETDKDV